MATISGAYDYIDESLVGTSSDDLFILGKGNEVAVGSHGRDTAQLPMKLSEYSSAIFFPASGVVALTIEASTLYSDPTIYFLEGIEVLEFSDRVIDLTLYAASSAINQGKPDELVPFTAFEFGQYDYIQETLTSDLQALFVPGAGSANIIASASHYNVVLIPGDITTDISFLDSRATVTLPGPTAYSEPDTYIIRDSNAILGLNYGYWFNETNNKWQLSEAYNLQLIDQNTQTNPAPDSGSDSSVDDSEAPDSVFEWGSLRKGENLYLEGKVEPGGTYESIFTTTGDQVVYTYFDLYNFTDDLDLTLYRYDQALASYSVIATSLEESNNAETIFKGMPPGDYMLEIAHFEDLDNTSTPSSFTASFDSLSFYENSTLPNDTLFASQWHLLNTGQAGGIDDQDIFAPEAWTIRSTSPDIVVAVIDGGVQVDHPDLMENIWINADEVHGNGIDDDNNGYVDDLVGWNFVANSSYIIADDHGTHVAGIIGAEGNNGMGVTGVTWDVQMMSLDVFGGGENATVPNIIEALYYAADNGADIINMSLGSTFENLTIDEWRLADPNGYSLYYDALNYAVKKGSTIVIAAGNDDLNNNKHLSIPAAFSSVLSGVISVAAVANTGNLTDYTNYGSLVTIAAPGGTHGAGSGILSTITSSMYEGFPGTSMAAPVVAVAAALLKAENPLFSPADIEAIITQSADKFKDMTFFVEDGNYLNLKEALTLAQTYQASSNASVDDPETTGPGSDASVDNSETTDSGPDTSVDDSEAKDAELTITRDSNEVSATSETAGTLTFQSDASSDTPLATLENKSLEQLTSGKALKEESQVFLARYTNPDGNNADASTSQVIDFTLKLGTLKSIVAELTLPNEVKADALVKVNPNTGEVYDFTYDPENELGAELIDSNNNGLVDTLKIHLRDGELGDVDGEVNGIIRDPGMLATAPRQTIYRFYNQAAGVHFYTPSEDERDTVIANKDWGYTFEGTAYEALETQGKALYRFYNPAKRYHFLSTSAEEAKAVIANSYGAGVDADALLADPSAADPLTSGGWGYTYEGTTYRVSTIAQHGMDTNVHRFFNPAKGVHFYSANTDEANMVIHNSLGDGYDLSNALNQSNLIDGGWGYVYEGSAWFV